DITDNVLAELRSASDIVEVIGEHTKLKKAGRSWKGLCPFHNERTPSFTVDRDKGLYHCFGCGAGGDVIHFVRQIDRLDFPEAVEALANRFGVKIGKRASRGPRDDRREKLLEALSAAQRFYAALLAKPGSRAAAYLEKRGVPEDFVRRLGLGAAPDSWDSLTTALGPAFPEALLAEAGLVQQRSEGRGHYDRFRDRLLFVLRDDRGRPVGFGGRVLSPDQEPKYLNSPESPVFLKKRLLYGLSEARDAIRRKERVVLVEGYFDHLALLQAGIEETVASMGTALTPEQAEKLRRLCPGVVVCYDGDSAGRAATRSALRLLLAQGLRARVARLPEGEDPHDVLGTQGAAALAARIEEAPDALDWLLDDVDPNASGLASHEKMERVRAVLEVLDAIPDRVLRYEEYRLVSRAVGVPVEVLWDKRGKRPEATAATPGTQGNVAVLSAVETPGAERRLLQVLMAGGEFNPLILRTLKDEFLTDPRARRIVAAFRQARAASEPVDFQREIAHLTEEERAFLAGVVLEESPEPTEKGVERLLKDLEKKYLERESAEIQRAIDRADEADGDELARLIRRKQDISRRRSELGR
ncbi:MAG: DNA primase, partial [Thermoanaerobaculia bacterium]